MFKHREGGISQPKMLFPRVLQHFHSYSLRSSSFSYHHRFFGLCCAGTVPSPINRRCTRTDRLAIAKNITSSTPVYAFRIESTCNKAMSRLMRTHTQCVYLRRLASAISSTIGCADHPRRHFRVLVPYGVSTREKQEPSLTRK